MAKKNTAITVFLVIVALIFIFPVLTVLLNSFKGQFYIADQPFKLPNSTTFSGTSNYIRGIEKTGFLSAFGYSLFITFFSVLAIVFFPSMTAWYIVRVKNTFTKVLYFLFVLSMVIPFPAVTLTALPST